jgi:hypothetical protein
LHGGFILIILVLREKIERGEITLTLCAAKADRGTAFLLTSLASVRTCQKQLRLIELGASSQNAVALGDVGRIAIGAVGRSLPRSPRSLSLSPCRASREGEGGPAGEVPAFAAITSSPLVPRSLSNQPTATTSIAPGPAKRWLMPEPSRLARPIAWVSKLAQ